MKSYLDLVAHTLKHGKAKPNRTKTPAITISGASFAHDLSLGFPLLTTKAVSFKAIKVELEFFIKGYTSKQWLQERNCRIWDEWANPKAVKATQQMGTRKDDKQPHSDTTGEIYSSTAFGKSATKSTLNHAATKPPTRHTKNSKTSIKPLKPEDLRQEGIAPKMQTSSPKTNEKTETLKSSPKDKDQSQQIDQSLKEEIALNEKDLGPIYGSQWRNFNSSYLSDGLQNVAENGVDQLKRIADQLKGDPTDRRMLVSSWNPLLQNQMALPPCHVLFHLVVLENKLHLNWFQRSCDLMLGIPFNIASYALLLHLLARHAGLGEGTLMGFFSDVHIYSNHVANAKKQLERDCGPLPSIETTGSRDIFDWSHEMTQVKNYHPAPKLAFEIAV